MQWLNSIEQAPDHLWQNSYPFTQKAFIQALEDHHSINGQTGWTGHFLYNEKQHVLLPSFLKQHSYGEYVFDWGWANAYEQHNLQYYPKLIIAAPFTPATGPRLITSQFASINGAELSAALQNHCHEQNLSGVHILFFNQQEREHLKDHNWHERKSVQFHWFNYAYESFDDYVSRFKSRKRKAILKERNHIHQRNIKIDWKDGQDVTPQEWEFFYRCYQATYHMRGMQGYLSLGSFMQMGKTMGQQLKLVMAYESKTPVACALYFLDEDNLYGRYWGATKPIEHLHFELCYYQGIEYCIRNNLKHFDPGTQGEHKIARGFEPVYTSSLHYLKHEGFHEAVGHFVKEEAQSLALYKKDCYEALPFNENNRPEIRNFANI